MAREDFDSLIADLTQLECPFVAHLSVETLTSENTFRLKLLEWMVEKFHAPSLGKKFQPDEVRVGDDDLCNELGNVLHCFGLVGNGDLDLVRGRSDSMSQFLLFRRLTDMIQISNPSDMHAEVDLVDHIAVEMKDVIRDDYNLFPVDFKLSAGTGEGKKPDLGTLTKALVEAKTTLENLKSEAVELEEQRRTNLNFSDELKDRLEKAVGSFETHLSAFTTVYNSEIQSWSAIESPTVTEVGQKAVDVLELFRSLEKLLDDISVIKNAHSDLEGAYPTVAKWEECQNLGDAKLNTLQTRVDIVKAAVARGA